MGKNKTYEEKVNDYVRQQTKLAREKGIVGTVIIDHSHIISDELKNEVMNLLNS